MDSVGRIGESAAIERRSDRKLCKGPKSRDVIAYGRRSTQTRCREWTWDAHIEWQQRSGRRRRTRQFVEWQKTETDGMISSSMMILLLYLPLPLRYKWAIWSEEEVQIYIQQKCFSVFFSFRRWWAPLFLCVSRSPPPFSSRFKFHLLCGTAALSCVYSIHDVIVGISSTKGTKDRQLAILSVLYFFSFLSTAHWFHFCWHEKNIYKIQKKRGPRWGVDRKSIKGFHSSVCARWRRVWWLMSLPGQGSKQADLFCSCAPPLSDPETRLLLMPLLLSEMLP